MRRVGTSRHPFYGRLFIVRPSVRRDPLTSPVGSTPLPDPYLRDLVTTGIISVRGLCVLILHKKRKVLSYFNETHERIRPYPDLRFRYRLKDLSDVTIGTSRPGVYE